MKITLMVQKSNVFLILEFQNFQMKMNNSETLVIKNCWLVTVRKALTAEKYVSSW